ncbi:peptidase S41 [Niabella sp. CC-SYL272]|uniref:S41 family peptidase n=1 Tax=Niabella agricola TaxID=2891571 RepID=UPI001F24B261|nr:S41 family peptidase [Niabella agricola]MCF3107463.1 peptidase S41 [Niabella agricola]
MIKGSCTFFLSCLLTCFNLTVHFPGNAQIANTISAADKVYGLSKFWQEVNYNFVYLDKIDRKAWDSTYKALIPQVQETKNDYEYYRLLEKFCAMLNDGHTNIFRPQIKGLQIMQNAFGDHLVVVKQVAGKPVIVRSWKKDQLILPVGSEIVEVNGSSAEQHIREQLLPYISSSTEYVKWKGATHWMLAGAPGSAFRIRIKKPDGKASVVNLVHAKVTDSIYFPELGAYYDEQKRELLEFKMLEGGVAYLGLNGFSNRKIDTLFDAILPQLYQAKGLIVDLRFNGGGSTDIGTYILKYLIADTVLAGARYTTREHLPAFKAWGGFVTEKDTVGNAWNKKCLEVFKGVYTYNFPYAPDTFTLHKPRIVVPTVILTGNNTASAAEDFLIAADAQKHMVRMGEPSFGSTGQPMVFDMPGGGSARVCTKKDTYPDGREFVGYGIQPHITVIPTVQDYLAGKDVVKDAALGYLLKKIK